MKLLDDVQKAFQGIEGAIGPEALAAILVLAPVAAAAGVALRKRYKARSDAKKAAQPLPPAAPSAEAAGAAMSPVQLLRAWRRFLKKLPLHYRRSILNFEQFVVLGAAGCGKSAVIDGYTDWRRQEKQFLASQTDDTDLPVYLTSRSVVTELPAKVLHDHGPACRTALQLLWRRLYAKRSPTVIVVVDAQRLLADPPDATEELAETIRGKINLLSAIRRRPLEVRVVLTRLDAIEGYAELASFCRAQGIAMFVPLPGKQDAGARIEAWLDDLRQHLPRALTALDAGAYRRVLTFLRRVPPLIPPLRAFLASLFAHEAHSSDPIRGGLYLAAYPAGSPNPLRGAAERGPGPDPRIRHLVAAALVASGVMTFFGVAFAHQYELWGAAEEALYRRYDPATMKLVEEENQRETIVAFTSRQESWLDTNPDFFAGTRERMRADFSRKLRDGLLVPGLLHVARVGKVPHTASSAAAPALPHQRSLYYLGLIHSDRYDALRITPEKNSGDRTRLHHWASMTGLDSEIIVDYLANTDHAHCEPVPFTIASEVDRHDHNRVEPWRKFTREVLDVMRTRTVELAKFNLLLREASSLAADIGRLRNADLMLDALARVDAHCRAMDEGREGRDEDEAVVGGGRRERGAGLARAYELQFREFQEEYRAFRDLDVDELAGMLDAVRRASLHIGEESGLLRDVVSRLEGLYARPSGSVEPRVIQFADEAMIFEESAWASFITDRRAALHIDDLVRRGEKHSIFFDRNERLPAVAWNPSSGAETIFSGRSVINGPYTRAAYESHVRGPVLRLRKLLRTMEAGDREVIASGHLVEPRRLDRRKIEESVTRQVEQYANGVIREAERFVQGFSLSASSIEALRIALALMSDKAGGTTFDDFLQIVDDNATVDIEDPDTRAEEPMLAPMKRVSERFARWHEVVDGAGASPRITQYKEILARMLKDLEAADEEGAEAAGLEGAATASAATAGAETLEQALAPPGRLVLAGLKSDKGAYASLIRGWIKLVQLPKEHQGPFLTPLAPLSSIGRSDIQSVVSRAFQRDIMSDLERVVALFPFDPGASEEVTPEELTALFHPKSGRVYDVFRRYLEPLSQVEGSGGFRVRPSVQESVALPDKVYRVINAAGVLSARLWDEEGKPRPLRYRLTPVPFGSATHEGSAPTLVYLNVGPASLFNFNQKPATTTLELDWTAASSSSVGVQLTDGKTKEDTHLLEIAADESCFSFLRLLRKAAQPPTHVKEPAAGRLYTWQIPLEGGQTARAQVVVVDDPWETFSLVRTRVNAARSR